jgi:hypothetical protein
MTTTIRTTILIRAIRNAVNAGIARSAGNGQRHPFVAFLLVFNGVENARSEEPKWVRIGRLFPAFPALPAFPRVDRVFPLRAEAFA